MNRINYHFNLLLIQHISNGGHTNFSEWSENIIDELYEEKGIEE